ncbi:hypothetical protein DY000_02035379, partial [Brassica cretica]
MDDSFSSDRKGPEMAMVVLDLLCGKVLRDAGFAARDVTVGGRIEAVSRAS